MKGKYFIAAGAVAASVAAYFLFRKKTTEQPSHPQKENERHHLTNAFAKAKQVAVGR
jgi:hypothetical protein